MRGVKYTTVESTLLNAIGFMRAVGLPQTAALDTPRMPPSNIHPPHVDIFGHCNKGLKLGPETAAVYMYIIYALPLHVYICVWVYTYIYILYRPNADISVGNI